MRRSQPDGVTAVRRPLHVHHKDIDITPADVQILLYFSDLELRLSINCVFASYAITVPMPERPTAKHTVPLSHDPSMYNSKKLQI